MAEDQIGHEALALQLSRGPVGGLAFGHGILKAAQVGMARWLFAGPRHEVAAEAEACGFGGVPLAVAMQKHQLMAAGSQSWGQSAKLRRIGAVADQDAHQALRAWANTSR